MIDFLVRLAYLSILGWPLIAYTGALSLVFLLLTASAAKLTWKGRRLMTFKTHVRLAYVTVAIVLFHGLLGLSLHI
ncbi:MAG: hypothetical protein ABIJ46_00310 [bacterium]